MYIFLLLLQSGLAEIYLQKIPERRLLDYINGYVMQSLQWHLAFLPSSMIQCYNTALHLRIPRESSVRITITVSQAPPPIFCSKSPQIRPSVTNLIRHFSPSSLSHLSLFLIVIVCGTNFYNFTGEEQMLGTVVLIVILCQLKVVSQKLFWDSESLLYACHFQHQAV